MVQLSQISSFIKFWDNLHKKPEVKYEVMSAANKKIFDKFQKFLEAEENKQMKEQTEINDAADNKGKLFKKDIQGKLIMPIVNRVALLSCDGPAEEMIYVEAIKMKPAIVQVSHRMKTKGSTEMIITIITYEVLEYSQPNQYSVKKSISRKIFTTSQTVVVNRARTEETDRESDGDEIYENDGEGLVVSNKVVMDEICHTHI